MSWPCPCNETTWASLLFAYSAAAMSDTFEADWANYNFFSVPELYQDYY